MIYELRIEVIVSLPTQRRIKVSDTNRILMMVHCGCNFWQNCVFTPVCSYASMITRKFMGECSWNLGNNYSILCTGVPYSILSVRPGADPGVQAVSPQVTISHPPGGRLPLLSARPSHPESITPFGWYLFYRPTEGRRLSRPGWLVTYRNKVPPPGVEPGHGHPSQY